ncbi:MAG: hypothetical protein Q7S13_06820, partial [Candidatus Omnitrophota bacterium]|nr:hypothetical protein [Candidatus Omnitrophota bacterium]
MRNRKKSFSVNPAYVIDVIGMTLIGLFSFVYVYFARSFAELHIQLPFLNFPIFIGEIFLGVCILLACLKYRFAPTPMGRWCYILAGYFIFILVKALYGYVQWGPLALRDSALFYYTAFFAFGYYFYRREYFQGPRLVFLIAVFLASFIFSSFSYLF